MPKKTTKPVTEKPAAPATTNPAAAPVPEVLVRIPLEKLVPSPHNPRHIDSADPSIRELADSIRANGLLQPGVARPIPDQTGSYELLAGGRRFAAHVLLGAPDMLCIVRQLNDQAALEVTVLENLQRSDLTPFEEARGVQSLLDTGHPVAEIAAELGKSPQWVARRAQLTKLIPAARIQFEKAESTVGHMLAFSALPEEVQKDLVKSLPRWGLMPTRLSDFLRWLGEQQHLLKKAIFPLDIPTAGAPPCRLCLNRTGANPDLFGDDAAPASAADDRCLKSACWEQKRIAQVNRLLQAAQAKHKDLVMVKTEPSDEDGLSKVPQVGKETWYDRQIVKQGVPGAVPSFVVFGPDAGKVIWTKTTRNGSTRTNTGKPARPVGADGKPVPPKPHERQLGLHQKRCAWMVSAFLDGAMGNLSEPFEKMPHTKVLNILLAFGSTVRHDSSYKRETAWEDYYDFGAEKGPDAGTLEAAFTNHLMRIFEGRVSYTTLDTAEAAYLEAARICRLFGYPLFKNHYEACMKALPVPKSWGTIPDPWADAPGDQVADPFDPKHELPRKFKAVADSEGKGQKAKN